MHTLLLRPSRDVRGCACGACGAAAATELLAVASPNLLCASAGLTLTLLAALPASSAQQTCAEGL